MPPVSAMNGTIAPSRAASARSHGAGDVGRAGEGDARDAVGRRRVPRRHVSPGPGKSASASAGTPASCRHSIARAAIERRLLGGLGDDGVARGERGGDLADEDRERKIPRADADEDAATVQTQLVRFARGAGQLIAARRTGVARAPRSSGRNPPPRAPRRSRRRASCPLRARAATTNSSIASSIAAAARSRTCGARLAAGGVPRRLRAHRHRQREVDIVECGVGDDAQFSRAMRGLENLARCAAGPRAALDQRPGSPLRSSPRRECCVERRHRRLVGEGRSRASSRAPAGTARAAAAASGLGIAPPRARARDRIGDDVSTGTARSAMRLTNDVLAPFSSSRRTR